MLRVLLATAMALLLGAVLALAAPGLSTRPYVPEPVEFSLPAAPAPAGVAADRGFVSPEIPHAQALQPGRSLVARRRRARDRAPRTQGGRRLDALDAGRRRWPPQPDAFHVGSRVGRRGGLGPVPALPPRPGTAPSLREHDRHRDREGPPPHPAALGRADRRHARGPRVGRDQPAADPAALGLGRQQVPHPRRRLRARARGCRPPHGHRERVLARPGASRDPRGLPVPPEHQRVERHWLQLRRRPVRRNLGGPRGGRRRGRVRIPGAGLQRPDHGDREPRRVHLGAADGRRDRRPGPADQVEARQPRGADVRHHHPHVRGRPQRQVPLRPHAVLQARDRAPRHRAHGVPGRPALLPAPRAPRADRRAPPHRHPGAHGRHRSPRS